MASVNSVHKDKDMNTWMVNYISKKCSKVFEQSIYSSGITKKTLPLVWAKFLN